MKCGHAAQGTRQADGAPVCIICLMSGGPDDPATIVDDNPPDLSGRLMRCSYTRGPDGRPCNGRANPRPSDPQAAFFSHKPNAEYDEYFDGCWGWD